jgi:hypothetical protein
VSTRAALSFTLSGLNHAVTATLNAGAVLPSALVASLIGPDAPVADDEGA